jgi:hypothetical protein
MESLSTPDRWGKTGVRASGIPFASSLLTMDGALASSRTLSLRNAAVAPRPRPSFSDNAAADVDPRWVIAVAAARSLEGGRAAIVTLESRRRVIALARTLGLREFDANLVIAIVQDAARRGEPLGGAMAERLEMVPQAAPSAAPSAGALLMMSLCLAGLLLTAMLWMTVWAALAR